MFLTGFRSYTNLRGIRHNSFQAPPFKYVIVTLDPNKFAEKKQQRLHIGNIGRFTPRISLRSGIGKFSESPVCYYDHESMGRQFKYVTYPPDTNAFLYYSMSPEKPRIAGELRLRVTSSDDPASFESGSDLLRLNGQPWSRPLCVLPKQYLSLYEKLREDRLVPDDLDAALSTLPNKRLHYRRSQLLYTLNDTFIVKFSGHSLELLVITEQGVGGLLLRTPFEKTLYSKKKDGCINPYTGSALARFERSTLQEHNGTRTVVLRFLKIITPVECVVPSHDNYVCYPKEGELHRRGFKRGSKTDHRVWSVNLDRDKSKDKDKDKDKFAIDSEAPTNLDKRLLRGLRLLWDT